ncbi:MAG: DNA-3-methyladenine glycosylase 2 family protein [bacterium]|nr:DNA-3-methyladenine glycosylase 2 family protein [Candidatus Kapabacteria bacterium]
MNEFSEAILARAVRTLTRRDPNLRPIARKWGAPTFRPHTEYFDTLVDAIISQQISRAAAVSVQQRLRDGFGGKLSAASMAGAPDEVFRSAGISPQKLSYLRSLAAHVDNSSLDLERLPGMDDEEVVAELTAVRGLGVWTAQMFLIFSLGRLDILPTGDLGVRKGTQIAYGLSDLPTPQQVESIAIERKWAPFRSVASWYMWRAYKP